MTHVVYVVTHPMTGDSLLRGQLGYLRAAGFRVTLVTAPGPQLEAIERREGVPVIAVPMRREISPFLDLWALWRLLALLRRLRPEVVNAGTPKAALLGLLAARAARVPVRIYTLRGLRLETARGFRRRLLAWAERVSAAMAQQIICVSDSLRRRYLELGLAAPEEVRVLGCGSSNGVDVERFHPDLAERPESRELRRRWGLADGEPVIGFLGRLTRDKGLVDLAEAFFGRVLEALPGARLLLVGGFEAGDPVPASVQRRLEEDPRVVLPGHVADAAPWYALMDVLAFPSFREGFPNAPLEAAACGLPVVGYAATGTVDAVVDGETGSLVPVGDVAGLSRALLRYLLDPALRRRHGAAGRARVEAGFRNRRVWDLWIEEYRRAAGGEAG